MRKAAIIASLVAGLFLTGKVYAGNLNAQLSQPQSPTNQSFNLTFVVLDTDSSQTITVTCFKQGPSDGGFVAFGSPVTLAPSGGNSGTCNVGTSVLTQNGTYNFQVTATDAGSGTATSNSVSVVYNTSGPGTPTNWSKNKTSCTYTIGFVTANDSGKTIKVNVYRSDQTNFSLDGGTLVGTIGIGSNTPGSFPDTPPDCSKTYYYAIRAFDTAGNGSGVLGDSQTVTVNTVVTPTPGQTQGAIPVSGTGNVLGTETATGATGAQGEVQAATTQEATPTPEVVELARPSGLGAFLKGLFANKLFDGILVIVLLGLLYAWRKNK